jgi:phosphatidylserine/phosphatidylglycerophosphate/cardiolipin synthase-like enzyme
VRSAADRGVRVRVLVDDLNTAGEDRRFMHLGST